jgi:hypothetical protein
MLASGYQDYVGGKYHAMGIFDFVADANDMFDTKNAMTWTMFEAQVDAARAADKGAK